MQLTALSSDGRLIAALAKNLPTSGDNAADEPGRAWVADPPQRVPGAVGISWWELAVDVGVVAAPLSIICNLIASWLWTFRHKQPEVPKTAPALPAPDLKLVLTEGDRTAELTVDWASEEAVRAAILAALEHVHRER